MGEKKEKKEKKTYLFDLLPRTGLLSFFVSVWQIISFQEKMRKGER